MMLEKQQCAQLLRLIFLSYYLFTKTECNGVVTWVVTMLPVETMHQSVDGITIYCHTTCCNKVLQ